MGVALPPSGASVPPSSLPLPPVPSPPSSPPPAERSGGMIDGSPLSLLLPPQPASTRVHAKIHERRIGAAKASGAPGGVLRKSGICAEVSDAGRGHLQTCVG